MTDTKKTTPKDIQQPAPETVKPETTPAGAEPEEYGGPKGLEPTRYGDWERKGILSDF
ncbi:MAG: DUF1674 domain-containing protein [Alphaproteobacteria bacterium]|jgi:hypothetical protein|nr:DUF1674 domain-containing protein [Alphaproteobacteria bacterium]MBT4020612.1 DUF1674 domain-containing protein [Alphaproteobacteria bacterium]MBT4965827.1 DUF1674 domain-containing protein [Alphaproteobacteria bacterium]MBT5160033.1 DUF1674 domain-containing protein [Alphaproteobacteria bacterium]MBT5919988.1 DUF1674 domain-containing protein [Alphaproteobacteria bacterium]